MGRKYWWRDSVADETGKMLWALLKKI